MRIQVNGVALYVDVEGGQQRVDRLTLAERPVIVVLHGGPGFDQGYLRPGLGRLSESAQINFVDLRGQGRSGPAPASTCTLEQMADDVAELCDRLGLVAPVVFGHSAGGFVALHLALHRPDLASGLILCDTAPTLAAVPDDTPPLGLDQRAPLEAQQVARSLFSGDFTAERMAEFGQLVMPYYAAPEHQDVPGTIMPLSRFAADVAAYFFTELAPRYDLRELLSDIQLPTLVIAGEYDWVCPPVHSRTLAHTIPNSRLAIINNAGHFPFSEQPGIFYDLVTTFIGDLHKRPAQEH